MEREIILPTQQSIAANALAFVEFFERKFQQREHLRIGRGRVAKRFVEALLGLEMSVEPQSCSLRRPPDDLAEFNGRRWGEMIGARALCERKQQRKLGEPREKIAPHR